jgi:hypothetical protein
VHVEIVTEPLVDLRADAAERGDVGRSLGELQDNLLDSLPAVGRRKSIQDVLVSGDRNTARCSGDPKLQQGYRGDHRRSTRGRRSE